MSPIREDFAGQRQLRFRLDGKTLHLFKNKGESTHQVYMKILVYALYRDRYDLEFDPRVNGKVQPDVASLDLTGEATFWAQCGELHIDTVGHLLKHTDAQEVVLVREAIDVAGYVAYVRRHVHYRYTTGRLRILSFEPLEGWFDPDHVTVSPAHYDIYEF